MFTYNLLNSLVCTKLFCRVGSTRLFLEVSYQMSMVRPLWTTSDVNACPRVVSFFSNASFEIENTSNE